MPQLRKEYAFSKRNFMYDLFREYGKLPFANCLKKFSAVFNNLYVNETRNTDFLGYPLMEVQLLEMSKIGTNEDILRVMFKHNLWKSCNSRGYQDRYVDYSSSKYYIQFIKKVCTYIKKKESVMDNVDLQNRPTPSPRESAIKSNKKRKSKVTLLHKNLECADQVDPYHQIVKQETKMEIPSQGFEFNFSNCLVRIY